MHAGQLALSRELSQLAGQLAAQTRYLGIELRDIKTQVGRVNGSIAAAHREIHAMKAVADIHHPKGSEQASRPAASTDQTTVTIGLLWKIAGAAFGGGGLVLGVLKIVGKI